MLDLRRVGARQHAQVFRRPARCAGKQKKTTSLILSHALSTSAPLALQLRRVLADSAPRTACGCATPRRGASASRTVTESTVPIDVLTRSDLGTGGYTETAQLLQSLVPSFNFPRPSLSDGTDHIRPATLRGLAPDQTLVLINGKRRHTSALVNLNDAVGRGSVSTDFNAIPASAIGQAEVLRDGASAQYGSDAIAGVINLVLRRDRASGLDVFWGATQRGDGRDLRVDAYAATRLGANGSLFVTLFSRNKSPTNRIQPDTRQQYFGIGPADQRLPISGNFGSGTGLSPANGSLDPREATVNRLNHRFGDPRDKSDGGWFNGDLKLAHELEAYFFGGATRKHGEGAGFFRRPGDDRTIRAIWPDGFLPVIQSEVIDLSLGAGIKGRTAGWSWDLSSVYGVNDLDYVTAQSINDSLGASSPKTFRDGSLRFSQSTTNLDLTNQFNVGFGAPLKVALGAEHRWEQYRIEAGEPDSYRDGGVLILDGPNAGVRGSSAPGAQVFSGFKPADAGTHTRDATAVYLDLEKPILDRWLLSVAGRYENYNDFGEKATGKVATRFALTKELALRASASTGFRAPHLAQQWFSSTATNNLGGTLVEVSTFPVTNPIGQALGARKLKPETSVNESVGLTFHPRDNFTGSIDFYRVEIDDRVVLSSNYTGSAVTNFLTSRGLPAVGGGRYFTNAVDTRTEGIDFTVRHRADLKEFGRLTLTGAASVNHTRVTEFKPTPPQLAALGITTPLFDLTERIRMEQAQPRNVINLTAGYDLNRWSFLLRGVRYGEVSTVALGNNSGVSAATINALTPGYEVTLFDPVPGSPAGNQQVVQTFAAKWITDFDVTFRWHKRLTLSAGVNNLFNIYPTENIRSRIVGGVAFSGNDNVGAFPYHRFSPFGFNGASYYTKASYHF